MLNTSPYGNDWSFKFGLKLALTYSSVYSEYFGFFTVILLVLSGDVLTFKELELTSPLFSA